MNISMFQVDAFTKRLFAGNPAAVVLTPNSLPESLMQAISAENNLSETAFVWPWPTTNRHALHIRWFTPNTEVGLCGHATLAAAHIVFAQLADDCLTLCFQTQRGPLPVRRNGQILTLSFPADVVTPCKCSPAMVTALGAMPQALYRGRDDYLAIFPNETSIIQLQPDMQILATFNGVRGVIVSAIADAHQAYDIVVRFFAPQSGIPEDPVTGSAHATLAPFWAERLQQKKLHSRQLSARGGDVYCYHFNQTVEISGEAVTFSESTVYCLGTDSIECDDPKSGTRTNTST